MHSRPFAAILSLMRFVAILLCLPLAAQTYDLVISNARIVDGTGNPWFYGDLAIKGERIARVTYAGALANATSKNRIDAHHLALSPGFIDIQGQSQRKKGKKGKKGSA